MSQVAYHPDDAHRLNDPAFWALAQTAETFAADVRGDASYSGASLGYPTRTA